MNRVGGNKIFRCSYDSKYSDGTLYIIVKKLGAERDLARYRAFQKNLFMDAGDEYNRILQIIQYQLEYRNMMRRLESYYGLRKKGH